MGNGALTENRIAFASLVAGSETPAGDGVTGAMRCVISVNGIHRAAILKRAPLDQVVAEAFAALLLRGWELPVPEPVLVDENDKLAFASVDVRYPNLKQRLALNELPSGKARDAALFLAAQLACRLPNAPLAAACDEAIGNHDRNLGNILWDGENDGWIDHAFSVGTCMSMPDKNKLCDMAVLVGEASNMQRQATARSLLLRRDLPIEVTGLLDTVGITAGDKAAYVAQKLNTLGNRLLARFPQPNDLLSAT